MAKKKQDRDPLLPPDKVDSVFRKKGRDTYNREYHPKIVYRLALLNLSEREMCVPLDIDFETFQWWSRTKPEFARALRGGRQEADGLVARALFRRAVGWGTLEEEVVSRKVKDKDGNERVETVTVPKRKKYPPDVAAIGMWLRNRHPDKWRVTESSVNVQVPVQMNVDLGALSLEELKLAQKLGVKQVNDKNNGHKQLAE